MNDRRSARPRAVVVYNSLYGNTRAVAEAVAEGLRSGMDVTLMEARGGLRLDTAGADLLVVGGPTHRRGLPERLRMFLDELGPAAPGGPRAAVFDTRYRGVRLLTGSAAADAARWLRRRGFTIEGQSQSFFVDRLASERGRAPRYLDEKLAPGECDRALGWGLWLAYRTLARRRAAVTSHAEGRAALASGATRS